MTNYGQMIKQAREEVGITQEALGKAVGVSGVTIMRYEKGQRNPSSKMIGKVAEVLGEPFLRLFLAASDEFMLRTKERLNSIRTDSETHAAETAKQAELELQSQIASFTVSPVGRSIISCFYELNELGQLKAEERIYELSEIPKYKRTDAEQSGGGIVSPPDDKKPPEGQETPSDGKRE